MANLRDGKHRQTATANANFYHADGCDPLINPPFNLDRRAIVQKNSAPGLSRKMQREEARASVLAAAESLFARRGFEGVAVDDIAELSGVRKQNLLYHFQSKESLWKETVDALFVGVDTSFWMHRVLDPVSWEGLRSFMRTYANICRERPAYIMIPLIEGVGSSWRTTWIAERHLSRHIANFEKYARSLIEAGVVADVDPLFLQNMLTGGVQISLACEPLWSEAIGVQSRAPEFVDHYLDAVLAMVRPAGDKERSPDKRHRGRAVDEPSSDEARHA